MNYRLCVSSSPHLHSNSSVRRLMADVIVATIPNIVAACVIFGVRAVEVILTTVLSCVGAEFVTRKAMGRDNTVSDLSAIVTGILLAFNLPVSINLGMAAFGGVIAIVVVKQFFGGLGQNFVNPALCARIILMTSFPAQMSNWTAPFMHIDKTADITTTATPLSQPLKSAVPSVCDMFLGKMPGCLGEVCSLAIILGGIYLILRGVISLAIPLSFIGTVAALTAVFGKDPLFHLLSGGLLLGAFFMATDYVTSPVTPWGRIIFGMGCGLFTVLIRLFGAMPEGVSFAVVLMNILVPHIERITMPKPFGRETHRT